MKQIFFSFIIFSCILFSCASSVPSLSGTLKGAENVDVYFDKIDLNNTTQSFGQSMADDNGNFTIQLPENLNSGIYRVRVGARSIDMLLDGSEKNIKVNGDLSLINRFEYSVEGSPMSSEFQQIMAKQISTKDITAFQNSVKSASPLVALHTAVKVFQMRPDFLDFHKEILSKLKNVAVKIPDLNSYSAMVTQLEQQVQRQKAMAKVKVGEPAPNIELKSPEGKTYRLSDLKGNVVLIDFWASWCGPCRKANPHVVELYHKYKSKGFTVYSVSLDGLDSRTKSRFGDDQEKINQQLERSKQRWVDAIKKDKLSWEYHVSDLKKWDSGAASLYGVRSIPQTFLVDKEGNISAINPKSNLEQEIQRVI